MDVGDTREAFLAGYRLTRTGRTDVELASISVRTAEVRFRRWLDRSPTEDD